MAVQRYMAEHFGYSGNDFLHRCMSDSDIAAYSGIFPDLNPSFVRYLFPF
ncbi:MAG: hypothetical protein P8I38_04565 [Arenicella sp.]|jgi:hypothetical protein|nr:hypothetical protein [Arenicella sp.]